MKGKIIKNCSYLILFITLFFFYQKNVFSLEIGVSTHIDSYSKEPDYYINLVKKLVLLRSEMIIGGRNWKVRKKNLLSLQS